MASLNNIVSFLQQPRNFYRIGVKGLASAGHLFLSPMAAAPTAAAAKGRVFFDGVANGLAQDDGTVFRHLSDRHIISRQLLAAAVDESIFVADRKYKVVDVKGVNTVPGTGGAATVDVKKCTGTQGPAAGVSVLTAPLDLTATANTVQTGTLTGTAANLILNPGDRLSQDVTGTLTSLVSDLIVILEQV